MKTYAALLITLFLAAGCTTYAKVTDPTTGKIYYTSDLNHRNSGAAFFTDARTGAKVSLQSSEVEPINKEQFESGKSMPTAVAK
jgi:hypothetical protein